MSCQHIMPPFVGKKNRDLAFWATTTRARGCETTSHPQPLVVVQERASGRDGPSMKQPAVEWYTPLRTAVAFAVLYISYVCILPGQRKYKRRHKQTNKHPTAPPPQKKRRGRKKVVGDRYNAPPLRMHACVGALLRGSK